MVSDYMDRPKTSEEVIHHKDFTHVYNNPDNLILMNRLEHFTLHSTLGTNSWKNGDVGPHKNNLSNAGGAFFSTEAGQKRRQEIAQNNIINQAIIEGLRQGRVRITQLRESDKRSLPQADYLKKWSPGIEKMQANNVRIKQEKQTLIDQEFPKICALIQAEFHPRMTIEDVSKVLSKDYPDAHLHSPAMIRDLFRHNGYASFNEYMTQTYQASYRWRNSTLGTQHPHYNHKVVSIEWLTEPADVGTLTIDEQHTHHDYHNFALGAGIFVMNSKGTEITTLPGGENLGKMEDVEYFQKKLYKSLNVPIGRLDSQSGGTGGMQGLGRVAELTRDEVKFHKFVLRLRNKFSRIFDEALGRDLVLTGVCSQDEWAKFREFVSYEYKNDNNFTELRDSELLRERVATLLQVQPFIGTYYSNTWVKRHVLMFDDKEIETMLDEIDEETKRGELPLAIPGQEGQPGQPGQPGGGGGPGGAPGGQPAPEPIDNTMDASEEPRESLTPSLDKSVEQAFRKRGK
jgi:hypothetical protein